MLAAVPSLRAFAMSLCRNIDHADDLVQETLLRALAHIDPAWLFTILRMPFDRNTESGCAKWKTSTAATPRR
jgi:RNA polymerase sigma-70 factor (ECF subfamily)